MDGTDLDDVNRLTADREPVSDGGRPLVKHSMCLQIQVRASPSHVSIGHDSRIQSLTQVDTGRLGAIHQFSQVEGPQTRPGQRCIGVNTESGLLCQLANNLTTHFSHHLKIITHY